MKPKVSVIVRVKNEKETLTKVLKILNEQTFQDFELIIVDDNSNDGSDRIAFDIFPSTRINIIKIPKDKFTHPYSCNVGAEAANGEYIVYTNGHSFPISKTWLSDGLKNFEDKKVAGVFAFPLAHKNTNLFEKFSYYLGINFYFPDYKRYSKYQPGVLGTTNAILRKDLWNKYHFSTKYKNGGEDGDWARHYMKKGYVIVQDSKFRVEHSHHLSPYRLIMQSIKYRLMAE